METNHHLVRYVKQKAIDGKEYTANKFYGAVPSIEELFKSPGKFLENLSPADQENIFYTISRRKREDRGPQSFAIQEHIAFDIDDIDVTREEETARAVCALLEVDYSKVGVLASGHGLQILIRLKTPIESLDFFSKFKKSYDVIGLKVNFGLKKLGLPGEFDSVVFDQARTMRVPDTWNVKPKKEKRKSRALQTNIEPVDFDLEKIAGVPVVPDSEQIKIFDYPDTETVLAECEFLKWGSLNPNEVKEPQWYAAASIIGRLENGSALFHTFSRGHKNYSQEETDAKLEQAMASSGPRTCASINTLWNGCPGCKHFKKCKSPINITGPEYIRTRNTGFRKLIPNEGGGFSKGGVVYGDLVKWFDKTYHYLVDSDNEVVYKYQDNYYQHLKRPLIKGFAEQWVDDCKNKDAAEFDGKVRRRHIKDEPWKFSDGKLNFLNGVLDIKTRVFSEHSRDHGFRFILPYAYEPDAEAPRFEKFLKEVTCGDEGLIKTLKEFGGYCLSNDPYWDHKALMLVGEGANGKSVFMDVLKSLAGGFFSATRLDNFNNDQKIALLDGKFFNFSEETSKKAFTDQNLETFKLVSSGGTVQAKVVYEKPYDFSNKAKLIFSCNNLPFNSADTSNGFKRRLLIVPFRETFGPEKRDPFLKEKLEKERPGILNIFLKAYLDMKERGSCFESELSKQELEAYMLQENIVAQWASDCVEIDPGAFCSNKEIYASFQDFCDANGIKYYPAMGGLSKEMHRHFKDKVKPHVRKVDGISVRGWDNIKLRG